MKEAVEDAPAQRDGGRREELYDRLYALRWGETTTNNYGFAPAEGVGPERFQIQLYAELLKLLVDPVVLCIPIVLFSLAAIWIFGYDSSGDAVGFTIALAMAMLPLLLAPAPSTSVRPSASRGWCACVAASAPNVSWPSCCSTSRRIQALSVRLLTSPSSPHCTTP